MAHHRIDLEADGRADVGAEVLRGFAAENFAVRADRHLRGIAKQLHGIDRGLGVPASFDDFDVLRAEAQRDIAIVGLEPFDGTFGPVKVPPLIEPLTKFMAGDPMKPATKVFAGRS